MPPPPLTRPPRVDLQRITADLAARQHGLVTRGQLMAAGATARRIQAQVESGRFRPIHRGVYLVDSVVRPHTLRLAGCLACGPGAVVSHRSAAELWGLVSGASTGRLVDVTIRGHRRQRPGIRVHRSRTVERFERTVREGVPVTTPTRTLLDLAIAAAPRTIERAVAEALARGLTTQKRLTDCLARHARRPGSVGLGTALSQPAPPRTRSEAEERFLTLVRRAGVPRPRVNSRIGAYEVDFHWPDARLVVEIDGFASHHSRPAFERDRRRDAVIVAEGYSVIRVTWRSLVEKPEEVAFRLGQALARRRGD